MGSADHNNPALRSKEDKSSPKSPAPRSSQPVAQVLHVFCRDDVVQAAVYSTQNRVATCAFDPSHCCALLKHCAVEHSRLHKELASDRTKQIMRHMFVHIGSILGVPRQRDILFNLVHKLTVWYHQPLEKLLALLKETSCRRPQKPSPVHLGLAQEPRKAGNNMRRHHCTGGHVKTQCGQRGCPVHHRPCLRRGRQQGCHRRHHAMEYLAELNCHTSYAHSSRSTEQIQLDAVDCQRAKHFFWLRPVLNPAEWWQIQSIRNVKNQLCVEARNQHREGWRRQHLWINPLHA
mmetsp:Transcript_19662/g.45743  ORF Transcript_19662/g.45743 Transcript_19662/m.45743 type:complete len:290 (+) Transcript_19662:129-998(+)